MGEEEQDKLGRGFDEARRQEGFDETERQEGFDEAGDPYNAMREQ